MTTLTNNTAMDNTSDAAARLWIAELIASFVAVGLVQTSDTGQVNTSTYTRPAINTVTAYACFRMNDTQQSVAPVFIKVLFGCGATTSVGRYDIQVGTATNGSGVLSGLGTANAADRQTPASAALSTVAFYVSDYCAVDGCFNFSHKIGASAANVPYAFFQIARSVNNSQVPTADSVTVTWSSGATTSGARTISYLTSSIIGKGGSSTPLQTAEFMAPMCGLSTSTLVSSVSQMFKAYYANPQVHTNLFLAGCLTSETGIGVQDTAALVGTTPRNYLNIGNCLGNPAASPATGPGGTMMIWE